MDKGLRKCTCTVIYSSDITKKSDYQIFSITVNHKGRYVQLLHYEKDAKPGPYKYSLFRSMYQCVLNILRCNNFYTGFFDDFGLRWYDIQWINTYDWEVEKYGISLRNEDEI